MASHVCRDDDLPKTIEYSDLFDLDDPSLEAELQLLSLPIADFVDELRRLQQSSDINGGIASPEDTVNGCFTVGKDKHTRTKEKKHTYANVVRTRYGVTGNEPTPESDPLDPCRSPRLQKKLRIAERSPTPPTKQPFGRKPRTPATSGNVAPLKSPLR